MFSLSFLFSTLDGKYFTKGNSFSSYYFGQLCSFTISEIQGFTEKLEFTLPSDTEDSLAEKIGEMKISGTSATINKQQTFSESTLKSDKDDSLCLEDKSFAEKQNFDVNLTKEDANDGSPATPKSNSHINNHFSSNNSLLNLNNSNVNSPLDTSTPVKVSQANIQGFQTPTQDNFKSKMPFDQKIFYKITSHTKIYVNSSEKEKLKKKNSPDFTVTFQSVGGLKQQIDTLKEIIQLPLTSPHDFASYGEFSFLFFFHSIFTSLLQINH